MKNSILFIALLVFMQSYFACRTANPAGAITSATKLTELTLNGCEQTIKYLCSKAKDSKSQTEVDMSAEIIINPTEKLITLNLESPQKGKGMLKQNITNIDCNLNANLTDGYSAYRALALGGGPRGVDLGMLFRVEAKNDGLVILLKNDIEDVELIFKVDSWEIVR